MASKGQFNDSSHLQLIAKLEGRPEWGTAEAALTLLQLSVFSSNVKGGQRQPLVDL